METTKRVDYALLWLRLALGVAMIYGHGWPKLMRLFSGEPIEFADPFGLGPAVSLGLATFAEFFCSILLMLGLYTRLALIPLIITMLVAILHAHAGDPFSRWEKPLLYLIAYLGLLLAGAGWFSLDARRQSGI